MTLSKRQSMLLLALFSLLWLAGCNASAHRAAHELVSLRTEETIWGHKISITPCVHSNRQTHSDDGPENSKHTLKCPNAEVVLENEVLSVNGKSYGKLAEKATVKVEHQKVFINDVETQPITQVAQN